MSDAAARIRRVICDVVRQALADANADGLLIQEDTTPEGELAVAWLGETLGADRVWRTGTMASNVHPARPGSDRPVLWVHPANKSALLLGGRVPAADLFPFGDVYASQIAAIAGDWSGPTSVRELAARAGGIDAVDATLREIVDRRANPEDAAGALGPDVAAALLTSYEKGRYFRLRPRLVPKLGPRTLGIDLFD